MKTPTHSKSVDLEGVPQSISIKVSNMEKIVCMWSRFEKQAINEFNNNSIIIITDMTEFSLCTKHFSKHMAQTNSLHPHNIPVNLTLKIRKLSP